MELIPPEPLPLTQESIGAPVAETKSQLLAGTSCLLRIIGSTTLRQKLLGNYWFTLSSRNRGCGSSTERICGAER